MDSLATMISGSEKSESKQQKSYAAIPQVLEVPNLIQTQINSFAWFKTEGLSMLFDEVSPIQDFDGGRFELSLIDH